MADFSNTLMPEGNILDLTDPNLPKMAPLSTSDRLWVFFHSGDGIITLKIFIGILIVAGLIGLISAFKLPERLSTVLNKQRLISLIYENGSLKKQNFVFFIISIFAVLAGLTRVIAEIQSIPLLPVMVQVILFVISFLFLLACIFVTKIRRYGFIMIGIAIIVFFLEGIRSISFVLGITRFLERIFLLR